MLLVCLLVSPPLTAFYLFPLIKTKQRFVFEGGNVSFYFILCFLLLFITYLFPLFFVIRVTSQAQRPNDRCSIVCWLWLLDVFILRLLLLCCFSLACLVWSSAETFPYTFASHKTNKQKQTKNKQIKRVSNMQEVGKKLIP